MDGQQGGSTVWGREKHHHPSPKRTLLRRRSLCLCGMAAQHHTRDRYYCLPNQQAPPRDREPTSQSCTEERGKPQGTNPSHWPCSVSHLSVQRWSPSGVALRSPFSTHLWPESGLCPSRDCSVTLPGSPSCNTIVTWPSP